MTTRLIEYTAHRVELRCDTADCTAVYVASTDHQHLGGQLYLLVQGGAAGWSMPTLDHLESVLHLTLERCDCVVRCPACTAGHGPTDRPRYTPMPTGPMYVVVELGDPTDLAHVVNGAEIIAGYDDAKALADDYNQRAVTDARPGETVPQYVPMQLHEVPAR